MHACMCVVCVHCHVLPSLLAMRQPEGAGGSLAELRVQFSASQGMCGACLAEGGVEGGDIMGSPLDGQQLGAT